jgi:hypothetical protein
MLRVCFGGYDNVRLTVSFAGCREAYCHRHRSSLSDERVRPALRGRTSVYATKLVSARDGGGVYV